MESTLGRECPKWCLIEAISKNQGAYSTICDEECALFSKAFNTCLESANIQAEIQKKLSKYRG